MARVITGTARRGGFSDASAAANDNQTGSRLLRPGLLRGGQWRRLAGSQGGRRNSALCTATVAAGSGLNGVKRRTKLYQSDDGSARRIPCNRSTPPPGTLRARNDSPI